MLMFIIVGNDGTRHFLTRVDVAYRSDRGR